MLVIINNVFPLHLALRLRNGQKKTDRRSATRNGNLEHSDESVTASTTEPEHDTSQSTSEKTMKRDRWSNNQTGALINA